MQMIIPLDEIDQGLLFEEEFNRTCENYWVDEYQKKTDDCKTGHIRISK